MVLTLDKLLAKHDLSREEIVLLLGLQGRDAEKLFSRAGKVREEVLGNKVYLRGLIELSNVCRKNCLYCGIRRDNRKVSRYTLTTDEILNLVREAMDEGLASFVLQSGEVQSLAFTRRITEILQGIRELSGGRMHVTLSCGEQSRETYREWLSAGAHRYLLRIESGNEALYRSIHPDDSTHSFHTRLDCLRDLRDVGYQTGSGIMIGLPSQDVGHLADDLLFLKSIDIDMVGMGPYVEHRDSPMFRDGKGLWTEKERFFMTRKMVAVLRLMMPDINIAATTASEALVPESREILISSGANVVMPNITPLNHMDDYHLYENKPATYFNRDGSFHAFAQRVSGLGFCIATGECGDPQHFLNRLSNYIQCIK